MDRGEICRPVPNPDEHQRGHDGVHDRESEIASRVQRPFFHLLAEKGEVGGVAFPYQQNQQGKDHNPVAAFGDFEENVFHCDGNMERNRTGAINTGGKLLLRYLHQCLSCAKCDVS